MDKWFDKRKEKRLQYDHNGEKGTRKKIDTGKGRPGKKYRQRGKKR